jgi:aerobic-type carbon monoxide dehydrogenase small subunit (CoxS/CutS family)
MGHALAAGSVNNAAPAPMHVDGEAVRSCSVSVTTMANRNIVTLEGLGTPENLHPVQKAFIDEQAVQCAIASTA